MLQNALDPTLPGAYASMLVVHFFFFFFFFLQNALDPTLPEAYASMLVVHVFIKKEIAKSFFLKTVSKGALYFLVPYFPVALYSSVP